LFGAAPFAAVIGGLPPMRKATAMLANTGSRVLKNDRERNFMSCS
jgi:hypothetical protein